MPESSVQFAIATHILVALAYRGKEGCGSAMLAGSVNADPSFVRKSVSLLAKAGLVKTTRGKHGSTRLAVPPANITLRDVSRAVGYPSVGLSHQYTACRLCPVSVNLRGSLRRIETAMDTAILKTLAQVTIAQLAADVRRQAGIEAGHRTPCRGSFRRRR